MAFSASPCAAKWPDVKTSALQINGCLGGFAKIWSTWMSLKCDAPWAYACAAKWPEELWAYACAAKLPEGDVEALRGQGICTAQHCH